MEQYLIAGLGNPDKKYEGTRHNAGFRAVDALAEMLGTRISEKKFRGLFASVVTGGRKLYLLKPLTYMNLSGESVATAAGFFKVEPSHVIVLSDDVNLACGRLRVRASGSAGGHNGLKNIIAHLGTDQFPRVRVGVGQKPHPACDMADWVLGKFQGEDKKAVEAAVKRAADAVECLIERGPEEAMNRYNG